MLVRFAYPPLHIIMFHVTTVKVVMITFWLALNYYLLNSFTIIQILQEFVLTVSEIVTNKLIQTCIHIIKTVQRHQLLLLHLHVGTSNTDFGLFSILKLCEKHGSVYLKWFRCVGLGILGNTNHIEVFQYELKSRIIKGSTNKTSQKYC